MRKTTWTASDHASSPGRRCSDGGVAISPRSDMAPRIFSPSATQIEAPGVSLYLQRARLCLRAVDLFVQLLKPCTHRRFRRRIWRRRTWWLRGGDALEAADGKRGGHHCGLGARLAAPPTPARPRGSPHIHHLAARQCRQLDEPSTSPAPPRTAGRWPRMSGIAAR